jgi:hypothetical protein
MTLFDRTRYFDAVRESMFGSLTQQQVDGQNFILDAWETDYYGNDLRWLSYFLATAFHETGATMWPIEEYGKGQGQPYGKPDENGNCFYGRGFVQLTWDSNYKRADSEFSWTGDKSCYLHPELQLDPVVSFPTGYTGMVEGWFRSPNKFDKFFSLTKDDPFNARDMINGDKNIVPSWSSGVPIGKLIEGYHDKFLAALEDSIIEEPEPEPADEGYVAHLEGYGHKVDVTIGSVGVLITLDGEQLVT